MTSFSMIKTVDVDDHLRIVNYFSFRATENLSVIALSLAVTLPTPATYHIPFLQTGWKLKEERLTRLQE